MSPGSLLLTLGAALLAGAVAAKLLHDVSAYAAVWMGLLLGAVLYGTVRVTVATGLLTRARGAFVVAITLFAFSYFIVLAGESWHPGRTKEPFVRLLQGIGLLIWLGLAGIVAFVISLSAGWRALGSPRSRVGAFAPLVVGLGLSAVSVVTAMTLGIATVVYVPPSVQPFVMIGLLLLGPASLHSFWSLSYVTLIAWWHIDPYPEVLARELGELAARTGFRFSRVLCLMPSYGGGRTCEVTSSIRGATLIISEPLLALLTPDELLAILAHEAAHVELNHLRRKMLFGAGAAIVGLALYVGAATVVSLIQPASLGFLRVLVPMIAIAPLHDLYTKRVTRRHEREADEYSARAVGSDTLLRALERLRGGQVTPEMANRWTTHSTWERRAAHLRSFTGK